jgi:hypothetical protein
MNMKSSLKKKIRYKNRYKNKIFLPLTFDYKADIIIIVTSAK